jgi:hypothetical protein
MADAGDCAVVITMQLHRLKHHRTQLGGFRHDGRLFTWRGVIAVLFCASFVTASSAGAVTTKVVPCAGADLSASATRSYPDSGDELAIVVKNKGRRVCLLDPGFSLLKRRKNQAMLQVATAMLIPRIHKVFAIRPGQEAEALLGIYRPVLRPSGCPENPLNERADAILVNQKTVLVFTHPAYFTSCFDLSLTGLLSKG